MKYIVFFPESDYEMMNDGIDKWMIDSFNRKIIEADNKRDAVYIRIAETNDVNKIVEIDSKSVMKNLSNCIVFCPDTGKFESSKNYDFSELETLFSKKEQDIQRAKDEAELKRLQEKLGKK